MPFVVPFNCFCFVFIFFVHKRLVFSCGFSFFCGLSPAPDVALTPAPNIIKREEREYDKGVATPNIIDNIIVEREGEYGAVVAAVVIGAVVIGAVIKHR